MGSNVRNLANSFQQKQNSLLESDKRVQAGISKTQATRRERLNTTALKIAECDRSKNPLVQGVWNAVLDYNREWMPPSTQDPAQVAHRIAILDFIYATCGTYMTQKSPTKSKMGSSQTPRRKLRYDAFSKLIEQVANEVESLGGRALGAPADFRETSFSKRNYWLERLDSHHRVGYDLSDRYAAWSKRDTRLSFWDWLHKQDPADDEALKNASHVRGYNNPAGALWEHLKYFNRQRLLVNCDDTNFSTQLMRTEFAGDGWAVFVCSLPMIGLDGRIENYIFSSGHLAGFDHHSSFLGGAPVMAAGEWVVQDGAIRAITAKSGHYLPRWENLHSFVTRFRDIPRNAIIRPDLKDIERTPGNPNFYRVGDFISMGLGAPRLEMEKVVDIIRRAGAPSEPGKLAFDKDRQPPKGKPVQTRLILRT